MMNLSVHNVTRVVFALVLSSCLLNIMSVSAANTWDANRIGREYLPLDTFRPRMESLQNRFPGLVHVFPPDSIPYMKSYEGREIICMRLSTTPNINDPNKPEVILTGMYHAREWIAAEVTIQLAERFVEGYYTNAKIRFLLQQVDIIVLPMINPDGYLYSWTPGGRMWRKNRRPLGNNVYGVDLNRNFPFQWGQQNAALYEENYQGPSAASELETQAVISLLADRDIVTDMVLFLSYHNYGKDILWPYGYKIGGPLSEVSEVLRQLFASSRTAMGFGIDGAQYYDSMNAAGAYPVSGDTVDFVHVTYDLVPAATIELRGPGFDKPVPADINQTALENFAMVSYLIDHHVQATERAISAGSTNVSQTHQKWWLPVRTGETSNVSDVMITSLNYDTDADGALDYLDLCVKSGGIGSEGKVMLDLHRSTVKEQGIGLSTESAWWWGVDTDGRGRRSCAHTSPPSVYHAGSSSRVLLGVFLVPPTATDGSDISPAWKTCRVHVQDGIGTTNGDKALMESALLAGIKSALPINLKNIISSVSITRAQSDNTVGEYRYCNVLWTFSVTFDPAVSSGQSPTAKSVDDVFSAISSQIGLVYDKSGFAASSRSSHRQLGTQETLSSLTDASARKTVRIDGVGYLAAVTHSSFIFPLWCYFNNNPALNASDAQEQRTLCESQAQIRYVLNDENWNDSNTTASLETPVPVPVETRSSTTPSLSVGAIIGIVIASITIVALAIAFVICFVRWRNRTNPKVHTSAESDSRELPSNSQNSNNRSPMSPEHLYRESPSKPNVTLTQLMSHARARSMQTADQPCDHIIDHEETSPLTMSADLHR